MVKLEIQVDGDTLQEANKVLHALGMDIEIAVGIFLKRITIEKGFPMTMAASTSKRLDTEIFEDINDYSDFESDKSPRSNGNITTDMVEAIWRAFLRHVKGTDEVNKLSTEVSQQTGMNRGSAFIYLMVLTNLVNGNPNTRVLKYKDLEYLMRKIKTELGEDRYRKALQSLRMSIPYWREKISGAFAGKVETYCKNHALNV